VTRGHPVAIILGSTRPGRVGEAVGQWVYRIARPRTDANVEIVDIKAFNLPLLDEPMPPSLGQIHAAAYRSLGGRDRRARCVSLRFTTFTPAAFREADVHRVIDEVVRWGAALKPLRDYRWHGARRERVRVLPGRPYERAEVPQERRGLEPATPGLEGQRLPSEPQAYQPFGAAVSPCRSAVGAASGGASIQIIRRDASDRRWLAGPHERFPPQPSRKILLFASGAVGLGLQPSSAETQSRQQKR
jgi:NADPH-dependent FMN reductase